MKKLTSLDGRIDYERERALGSDIDLEPIKSEDEDYESSPPSYKISTYPADYTLEVLDSKWRSGEIIIPVFQRGFVWKQVQASKLIESFLIGLPVPAVFFYTEQKSQKYFVIDGQQRLKSIFYYFDGYFGEELNNKRKIFRLTGLSEKSRYYQKEYADLTDSDKLKLKNSVLRSFVVQQLNPNDDTSMYHIFERLNTGGTLLTNQEVRNCVYHGKLITLLKDLNKYDNWRIILGKDLPDSRQKDIELIVRFFSMRDISAYEKPLKDFISNFMRKNANADDQALKKAESIFTKTCDMIVKYLEEKPFHIRSGLNAAVFDSVMVAISKHLNSIPNNIKTRYAKLIKDQDYDKATRTSTTDIENIELRFNKADEVLFK